MNLVEGSFEHMHNTINRTTGGSGGDGYWSPRTSSMDWCEENYVYTVYVAEMWNTLSSLFISIIGLYGLWRYRKDGFEERFAGCYGCMVLVGLGSAWFHCTLLYLGQAADELSMIWASLFFALTIWHSELPPGKSFLYSKQALLLLFLGICITVTYFSESEYFQYFLAFYCAAVAFVCFYSYRLRSRSDHEGFRLLYWVGLALFVGGSAVFWIPSTFFCRHVKGMQLHALFHVTSALGAYCFLVFALFHRLRYLRYDPHLKWYTHDGLVLPLPSVTMSKDP